MRNFKVKIFIIIFALFGLLQPVSTDAALVNCGRVGQRMCTTCDLIVGIKGVMDWGFRVSLFVAMLILVAAAIMYAASGGDKGAIENAKKAIKATVFGLVFLVSGWLMVNVTINLLGPGNNDLGSLIKNWNAVTCR